MRITYQLAVLERKIIQNGTENGTPWIGSLSCDSHIQES